MEQDVSGSDDATRRPRQLGLGFRTMNTTDVTTGRRCGTYSSPTRNLDSLRILGVGHQIVRAFRRRHNAHRADGSCRIGNGPWACWASVTSSNVVYRKRTNIYRFPYIQSKNTAVRTHRHRSTTSSRTPMIRILVSIFCWISSAVSPSHVIHLLILLIIATDSLPAAPRGVRDSLSTYVASGCLAACGVACSWATCARCRVGQARQQPRRRHRRNRDSEASQVPLVTPNLFRSRKCSTLCLAPQTS